jgi:hypothetical protein
MQWYIINFLLVLFIILKKMRTNEWEKQNKAGLKFGLIQASSLENFQKKIKMINKFE